MTNKFSYPRGSEWRRWDLHAHSPASYGGKYEEFVKNIQKCEAEVIGINDYFTIDGYENILKLDTGDKIIFPVIEFRMCNMVLDKNDPRLKSGAKINFHIIFNNDINIITRIRTWLNALECFCEGGKKETFGNIDLEKEREKLTFNYFDVIERLESDEILKNCYLVWLPYDEYGGIDKIDPVRDGYFKLGVINKADIIGSSTKKQIDFFLWKHEHYEETQIKKWLNGRKIPCIKGSDAHEITYPIGKLRDDKSKPTNKYCWIKSDPTFEGLKQIKYEPGERVYIGEEPPAKIDRSRIIKSITLVNSNKWFEDNKLIELNEGLISVIGGKGTRKTALLDLLAYASQSYRRYKKKEGESKSFLEKAFRELKGTKIKIEWDDGSPDEIDIGDKIEDFREEGKVRYLPQDFIEEICTELGRESLEKQMENVIFQNVPKEYKATYSDFSIYKNAQIKVINNKKKRIDEQMRKINSEIFGISELIVGQDKKKNEIKKIEKDILKLKEEMKKISISIKDLKEQQKILNELNALNENKSNLERTISVFNSKLLKIDEIKNRISVFTENAEEFAVRIKEDLRLIQISEGIIENIKVILLPENVGQVLENRKREIAVAIKNKKKELDEHNRKIQDLNKNLKLEKSKQDKIKEINTLLGKHKEKLDSIKEEVRNIETSEKNLPNLFSKRDNLFISFFEILFEEKEKLKSIYSSLESILKASAEENEKLFDFSVQFNFNVKYIAEKGDSLIDHKNEGRFWHKTHEALIDELEKLRFLPNFENVDMSNNDKNTVKRFLKNVRDLFLKNENGRDFKISSQLRKGHTEKDFYDWLYSTDYYTIVYSIKFNNIDIDNLSPGLKGVALLILYLELDKEDIRPILIDQPEENLDNRSVYKTLMRYFRSAKQRRQIVIITHNPNLVVNTDSEQIIVADFDRGLEKQKARICYVSGSLENSFRNDSALINLEEQGIREHVCEILEGGKEAFEKREQKYGFR